MIILKLIIMKKTIFILLTFLSLMYRSQVATALTTRAALDELSKTLTQTVDQAMDRADYSVASAAMKALSVLDAWKETNSDLLDKAFTSLDAKSRDTFSRMEALSNDINSHVEGYLDSAKELTVRANQITENLITSKKRSFILDYSPKVIFPTLKKTVLFTISGVNLDKAKAKYKLKNGQYINLDIQGPTKASFELPVSELTFDIQSPQVFKLELEHETKDGSFLFIPYYAHVKRTLLISSLPSNFGNFEINGIRTFNSEERKMYEVDAGEFRATNSNVWKMANPLVGFRWDLRNGEQARKDFAVTSYGGEAARCENIMWGDSNEHGISIQARCDRINKLSLGGWWHGPGHINCGVKGPVYKIVEKNEPIAANSGIIKWNIDQLIDIPGDLTSFQLKVKMYDGKERIITNDYADGILRVIKNSNNIIVRTTPPTSF